MALSPPCCQLKYLLTYLHTYSTCEAIYWFMVKPSEIGMKNGISHSSAGVLVFSFQLAITPPPETVIGQCIATAQSYGKYSKFKIPGFWTHCKSFGFSQQLLTNVPMFSEGLNRNRKQEAWRNLNTKKYIQLRLIFGQKPKVHEGANAFRPTLPSIVRPLRLFHIHCYE